MSERYIQKDIQFRVENAPEMQSFDLTREAENPYAGVRDIPMAEFRGDLPIEPSRDIPPTSEGKLVDVKLESAQVEKRKEAYLKKISKKPLSKWSTSELKSEFIEWQRDEHAPGKEVPFDFVGSNAEQGVRGDLLRAVEKQASLGEGPSVQEFLADVDQTLEAARAEVKANGGNIEEIGSLAYRLRDIRKDYEASDDRTEYNRLLQRDGRSDILDRLPPDIKDRIENGENPYKFKEFRDLKRLEMSEHTPRNIEDFALAIQATNKDWIEKYDMFDDEGNVIQANMLRWVRERMMFEHDDSPDDVHNYFEVVALPREYRDLSLGFMLRNQAVFFQSVDGDRRYNELADQMRREAWTFTMSRRFDIEYQQIMGDDSKLPEKIAQLYYLNVFTKPVWEGKSALFHIFQIPEWFKANPKFLSDSSKDDEVRNFQDAKVGGAINSAFLAYFHLADFEELQRLMGANSLMFNREHIHTLRNQLDQQTKIEGRAVSDETTMVKPGDIDKMFNPDGSVNPLEYIKFVNFFNQPKADPRNVQLVRRMISSAVADIHKVARKDRDGNDVTKLNDRGEEVLDIDEDMMHYAETFGFSMIRWTMAASRNDVNAAAYDAASKFTKTQWYRKKQFQTGNNLGNLYSVRQFKQTGIDLLTGIRTIVKKKSGAKIVVDDHGRTEEKDQEYYLRPIDVMRQMHEEAKKQFATEDERKRRMREVAGQLVFENNAMRAFAVDQVMRQSQIYEQIMSAGEIEFKKFTHESYLRGIVFDQAGFAAEVQKKVFTPIRYAYRTFGDLDYRQMVRVQTSDDIDKDGGAWQEMPLAQALFGYELLNTPKFRKWKPGVTEHQVHHNPGDKSLYETDEKGNFILDLEKIQSNKTQLMKQIIMMRIATELFAHRDINSRNPAYDAQYYETVIKSLELIPEEALLSEEEIKTQSFKNSFFDHADMQYFREVSDTKMSTLLVGGLVEDSIRGGSKGIGNLFSGIIKNTFK